MKNNRKDFRHLCVLTCLLALGWGILYPEYTLLPDTCRVVALDEQTGELRYLSEEELSGWQLYERILSADREQITFKSKLMETLRDVCLQKKQICD